MLMTSQYKDFVSPTKPLEDNPQEEIQGLYPKYKKKNSYYFVKDLLFTIKSVQIQSYNIV